MKDMNMTKGQASKPQTPKSQTATKNQASTTETTKKDGCGCGTKK